MESAASIADPAAASGMIVMVRADPVAAARALADDLHAEVVIGAAAARDVAARLVLLPASTPDVVAPAVDRLHRDLSPDPGAWGSEPETLASAVHRCERVRDATRAAAADRIAAALNTRLAIHPDTVRRAAAELVAARRTVESRPVPDPPRPSAARHAPALLTGAVAMAVAAGAGAAATGHALPAAGAALAALALAALAATSARTGRRPVDTAADGGHSDLMASLRVAERRWVQVAGRGIDPSAVEELIHRYEPRHHVVAALVEEHPAVRAVERAAMVRHNAWVRSQRAGGDGDGEQLWLSDEAPPAGPATVVVAVPSEELSATDAAELRRCLLAAAIRRRVVLVLPPAVGPPLNAGPAGHHQVDARTS